MKLLLGGRLLVSCVPMPEQRTAKLKQCARHFECFTSFHCVQSKSDPFLLLLQPLFVALIQYAQENCCNLLNPKLLDSKLCANIVVLFQTIITAF